MGSNGSATEVLWGWTRRRNHLSDERDERVISSDKMCDGVTVRRGATKAPFDSRDATKALSGAARRRRHLSQERDGDTMCPGVTEPTFKVKCECTGGSMVHDSTKATFERR